MSVQKIVFNEKLKFMYLKQITFILLGLMILAGCQNSKKDNTQGHPDEQMQNPQQMKPGQQIQQSGDADISDEELKKFATVNSKMQAINQEMQQKMTQIIEKNGMDMNQFNQIQQNQQNPDSDIDVSESDMNKYRAIINEMREDQAQTQKKAQDIIESEGLTMQRYQQIGNRISNDPEMQNKLREMQY